MPLSKQEWLALEKKAHELRRLCLDTTYWAGSGHIGGGMSVMDMLTVLYHKYMRLDVKNPKWEDRDRFILSKGHAGIAYAPVLVDFGWNDPEQLKTFNHTNSKMGIHLDSNKVVGVDASTGSLGHGLPIAVGTALAARVLGKDYKTYCILGDGECDEGSNWEAAMSVPSRCRSNSPFSLRSKFTPHFTSSAICSGALRTTCSTARRSLMKSPAIIVSSICLSKLSTARLVTEATPP